MFTEQIKVSHLILGSSLISKKKWAPSDDQDKCWKQERQGIMSSMSHIHPASKHNSGHSLVHRFTNKKRKYWVRLHPAGLTPSGSSFASLGGTADVNLSTSCHWVSLAISFTSHYLDFLFHRVPVRLFFSPPDTCCVIWMSIFVWHWALCHPSLLCLLPPFRNGQLPTVPSSVNQIISARVPLFLAVIRLPPLLTFILSAPILTLCDCKDVAKAAYHLKHWWGPFGYSCCRWAWRVLSSSRWSVPAHWSGHSPLSQPPTARSCQWNTHINNITRHRFENPDVNKKCFSRANNILSALIIEVLSKAASLRLYISNKKK